MALLTRVVAALAVTALALLLAIRDTSASPLPGLVPGQEAEPLWSIQPLDAPGDDARTRFELDVTPGDVVRDSVSITNRTDESMALRLYAADAYNTPGDGAFALRAEAEPKQGVAAWVLLPVREQTVPPLTRVDIPFAVHVPRDAEPGDHIGGIVALDTAIESSLNGDAVEVAVRRAIGVRIYAQVQGRALPELDVDDVSVRTDAPWATPFGGTGAAVVAYEVRNTGNTRVRPTARVSVEDAFGRTVRTFAARPLPELLPGGSVTVEERWPSLPSLGVAYTATVIVTDGAVRATGEGTAWVVPWTVFLTMGAVDGAVLLWARRRRPGQRPLPADAPPRPAPTATV